MVGGRAVEGAIAAAFRLVCPRSGRREQAPSRSRARCRGFWQVTPSCANSRPTETRLNAILNLSLINFATISCVHNAKATVTVPKIHLSVSPSSFGGGLKGFAFDALPPPRRVATPSRIGRRFIGG